MREDVIKIWKQAAVNPGERVRLLVWLECLQTQMENEKIGEYLDLLLHTEELLPEEKLCLYWQIHGMLFTCPDVTAEVLAKRYLLWRHISERYQQNFPELEFISDRKEEVVLVTVQQFLGMTHGPTKTTLDRAYALQKMGKKVLIVNTAEMLGGHLAGVRQAMRANYNANLSECTELEYLGERFPYVQFGQDMPSVEGTRVFLNYIFRLKPKYIVNIGGDSLTLDCAARMIPVLNINTVPSAIDANLATRQVIGRKSTKEDIYFMELLGLGSQNIIEGRFTWSLKPQENKFTRKGLGFPAERFILAVIGGRLTQELDWNFVEMLEHSLEKGAFLIVIGKMDTYPEMCLRSKLLKENSIYMGMQSDVLAILECCDLYVNPKRKGGGTSVIEAMYKGIPAVTLDEGDVALGAGKEFCVKNYGEMQQVIERYMQDRSFYEEMSVMAKKRADYMLDSETAFAEIISTFEDQCL